MKDELLLTHADEMNYRAVCAVVTGRLVRRTDERVDRDRLSQSRKLAMLQRQDYCCAECGREFKVKRGQCPDATLEHIIPFRFGSTANTHNTMLVCLSCNKQRDRDFSIAMIERHFGSLDRSRLDYVPVVRFQTPAELNHAAWRSVPRVRR